MRLILMFLSIFFTSYCHSQKTDIAINYIDGKANNTLNTKTLFENNDVTIAYAETDNQLYVVIRSKELYVASLTIWDSDIVTVYHASAALDELVFTETNNLWLTKDSFDWDMRETDMSETTLKKRHKFYNDHGWLANTMDMGTKGVTEFLFNKRNFIASKLKLGFGLMTADSPEAIVTLNNDNLTGCGSQSLVSGSPENSYAFKISTWLDIQLKPKN